MNKRIKKEGGKYGPLSEVQSWGIESEVEIDPDEDHVVLGCHIRILY